ncbi:MAG: flagellar hook-associated protein FlgK [Acidobacteria bacterium]|nr:flagellar hook-associated protein FlgK [Acidobacteriota bacterium]
MMGLFTTLSSASRALEAQQYGLEITGQNIANLNTEGYARRSPILVESSAGSGGGVEAAGLAAARDQFVETRLRSELPAQASDGAIADALAVVQTSLGDAGRSIDGSLTAFFDAFASLAQNPLSPVARDGVVLQGGLVAASFNEMAARLDESRTAADDQVRAAVNQVNTLASQIARLNAQIGGAGGADVEALEDSLGVAIRQLSALAPVAVMAREGGGADVSIGAGRALVIGANPYALDVASSGLPGFATIAAGGSDVTAELSSGTIGGLLRVRDTLVPGYQSQLDRLASDFASAVNAAHGAGFDGNGAAGQDFFTPPGAVAGAAAALAMNPAIAADPALVAASGTGAAGDNQAATAIAQLRDATAAGGGQATFAEAWSQLVYHVATDARRAQSDRQGRTAVVEAIQRLRDSVSGVSLDQEAGLMLRYQRAYEANAKFFGIVNGTLDTLLGLVRG